MLCRYQHCGPDSGAIQAQKNKTVSRETGGITGIAKEHICYNSIIEIHVR